MIVVPSTTAKVLFGFALLISLRKFNAISRSGGIALLGSLFAASYLLSPYWLVPGAAKHHCIGDVIGQMPAKIVTISILFVIGALWAALAAEKVPIASDRKQKAGYKEWVAPSILALLVLAFNYMALHNCIAVGGDEEWHIWRWEVLRNILRPLFEGANVVITTTISVLVFTFLFWLRRIVAPIKVAILCVIGLIICLWTGFPSAPKLEYLLVRYPFVSCWFHQLGPIWKVNRFDIGMFRLIPILSAFAIGWFALWALRKEKVRPAVAVIVGITFALTPNIHHHSTILYLEMPAIALLMVALYFIEHILKDDFKLVRRCPGWYALLAAGFIKETLVIIILVIIGLRIIVRAYIFLKNKELNRQLILHEIAAGFCIALPLGVYLFFRTYFGEVRGYEPNYANLTDPYLYAMAVKALWAQFAGVLILAVGGVIIGLMKRRFVAVLSLVILFVSDFFFHFMDKPDYVGIARFNLFLFSPLAVLALMFLAWLRRKNQTALMIVAIAALIINTVLSPVAITGEKDPMFGAPCGKWGMDYYFQHQDAVNWLKANRPNWPVLVGGNYSKTRMNWYFAKAKYYPRVLSTKLKAETTYMNGLKATIADARKGGYPLVLFHKMEGGVTLTEEEKSILGYKAIKIFKNRYLALVLYQVENLPEYN
jgi:hypothetical protein